MNCAKNLLYLVHFNPNSRAKLRGVLEFAFLEVGLTPKGHKRKGIGWATRNEVLAVPSSHDTLHDTGSSNQFQPV